MAVVKCIVETCPNWTDEGRFVMMCAACWSKLEAWREEASQWVRRFICCEVELPRCRRKSDTCDEARKLLREL